LPTLATTFQFVSSTSSENPSVRSS